MSNRDVPNVKFIDNNDVYNAIKKCKSKVVNITYCSLNINNKCMNTESISIEIIKIHQNCNFIEGVVLKNGKPHKDLILKASSILSIECATSYPDNNMSFYDVIKFCDGLVKITQCTKIEKGKCTQRNSFPFLVKSVDKKENVIKGYKIKLNQTPEYMVISGDSIIDVDCITNSNTPNFPWWIIQMLSNTNKQS